MLSDYPTTVKKRNNSMFMKIYTIKRIKLLLFSLMIAFISTNAFAQVPPNDEPCGAILLTPTASCSFTNFTNIDASDSQAPGILNPTPFIACGPYAGGDVWFKTTVPIGATSMVIDTKNLSMNDGAMTVYTATGTCPTLTLTQIACADDGSSNPAMPKITITQPSGTVLYIRIYGVGGELGTFGICVTANIPPANDDCANAIPLTVNPDFNCTVISSGNTTNNATQSLSTPAPPTLCSGGGINDDVWFSFVATGTDHRVSLSSVSPATVTMAFAIYDGSCNSLVLQSCVNGSVLNANGLTAGNTYLIRVYTQSALAATNASFSICVGTLPPPPLNDDCAGAVNLTVNSTLTCTITTSGTTQSATLSAPVPNSTCGVANAFNDDVWYKFIATSTDHRISLSNIVSTGAAGMVITAYSGTCTTLTEIGCSTTSPLLLNSLVVGNSYYLRIFTNTATATTVANFDICIATPPPPPANDECVGSILLTVNPTLVCSITSVGTTQSATQSLLVPTPSCGVFNANNDDVWFSFIATSISHRISLSTVTPIGTAMGLVVYSGTCTGLTEIDCSTSSLLGLFGLTPGVTYFVRVFTNSSAPLIYSDFNICVSTPPPPPLNDECLGAINLPVNPDYACALTVVGTTTNATPSTTAPTPTCATSGFNDDVWFSFIATGPSHRISFSNIVGTLSTLTKVVYSGNCGSLTQIVCTTGNLFNVNGLITGSTYYVRVFTTSTSILESATSFNLCVGSPPPPPANDNCIGAINLTVNPDLLCGALTNGTITSATASSGFPTPSCSPTGVDDDVWFKFTATAITHRITLTNVTPVTGMTMVVYSGTCLIPVEIFCNTTGLFNVSGLTIGQSYFVRVYSSNTTPNLEVDFRICVGTLPPPPPNDECTGAIPLTVSSNLTCATPTSGTTLGATQSSNIPAPSCSTPNGWNDDVWYSIIATSTSHRISLNNITGPTNNMVTTVYSGTCAGLIQVVCNTANAFDANNLIIGNTYYIRVHTAVSTFEDANFTICVGSPAPNRTCATSIPFCNQGAQEVNFTSTQGIASMPGAGGTGSIYGCLGTTPNQNWFDIGVTTAGSINIEISQVGGNSGNDVDFCAWGPFTSPADGCSRLFGGGPPLQPLLSTGGNNGCSYSTLAIENFRVLNVLPGQFYKLLVTNFSSSNNNLPPFTSPSQFVKLKNLIPITAGAATLDCNFPCFSASASNSGPVCGGSIFNLTSTGSTTPFSWTGPNGFTSNLQNPTGITAPLTAGNYTYTVTIGTGTNACVKPTTLVVGAPPSAPVVSATQPAYCQGAGNAVPLTATASAGNTLLWYTVATGGTGVTTLTPNTSATTTYYVSQVTAGGCEGPRTALTITITATPSAPVVSSPVSYCENETAVPLSATPTAGNSILFYTVSTGGTGVTTFTPPTTTAGSSTYYASQITSNNCEGPRSSITVTVKPRPAAPTTSAQVFCEGATIGPLTAGGIVSGASLLWYTTATGGSSIPTPTPSNTASSTYYVSQILNGCESPRTALTTTITPTPSTPVVVSTVQLCPNEVTNPLTASYNSGNTLLWYSASTGGTSTSNAPTPSTLVQGTFNFYVSQLTSNGCESPRAVIKVTVSNNNLFVNAGADTTICEGRKVKFFPTISSPLATFEWRSLNASSNTIDSVFIKNATVNPVDTTEYIVKALLNGCSVEDTVKVNMIWKPFINAGNNIPICINDSILLTGVLSHVSNTNINFLWTSNFSDTLNTPNQLQTFAHPLRKTIYTFTVTTDSLKYGCSFKIADSMIVAIQPIIKAFAGKDTIAAKGISHQLHGTGGLNYVWSSAAGINIADALKQNAYVKLTDDANFYLEVSDAAGCKGFDSIFVKVYNGNTYYVPNSFTPNADGLNDVFRAIPVGMSNTVYFRIFNRMGELMFETNQYLKGWDGNFKGKLQPNGVYVWMVGGTDRDKKKVFMQGTVMLIR